MSGGLTPKRESFAQRVVEMSNASEAYRQSFNAGGMSDKTVWEAASRLMADSKVSARVAELKERQLKKHDVTVERVLREYAKLAFLDIRKAFDENGNLKAIQDLDDDTAAAIAGLEVDVKFDKDEDGNTTTSRLHKLKLSDKRASLDSLAKTLGLFTDKLELTGKDGGPILVATKEQRDAAVAAALSADT